MPINENNYEWLKMKINHFNESHEVNLKKKTKKIILKINNNKKKKNYWCPKNI